MLGKTARVTAKVTSSSLGEVMVSVRQGTEAYFAYAADSGAEFPVGQIVTIIDEGPGRTVYIS